MELERILSAPLSKKEIDRLGDACGTGPTECVGTLYRLCFHPHGTMAFRAAWVLESVAERYPDRFGTIASSFLSEIDGQLNRSCQRHFTKILMFMTAPKAPEVYSKAIAQADRERLVETMFDWLIDSRTPVAVAVNCLDVLVYFTAEFDWIAEELEQQIEMRIHEGSPAFDSRGKRILKKLRFR